MICLCEGWELYQCKTVADVPIKLVKNWIVVLKIASGADNFCKASLWLCFQQLLSGVQISISRVDPHQISLIVLLLFLLKLEQVKCYFLSLLFHLQNLYANGFSTNLYADTFFDFICEVLWQFICEVLLLGYVGNYVKACSIYHIFYYTVMSCIVGWLIRCIVHGDISVQC